LRKQPESACLRQVQALAQTSINKNTIYNQRLKLIIPESKKISVLKKNPCGNKIMCITKFGAPQNNAQKGNKRAMAG